MDWKLKATSRASSIHELDNHKQRQVVKLRHMEEARYKHNIDTQQAAFNQHPTLKTHGE